MVCHEHNRRKSRLIFQCGHWLHVQCAPCKLDDGPRCVLCPANANGTHVVAISSCHATEFADGGFRILTCPGLSGQACQSGSKPDSLVVSNAMPDGTKYLCKACFEGHKATDQYAVMVNQIGAAHVYARNVVHMPSVLVEHADMERDTTITSRHHATAPLHNCVACHRTFRAGSDVLMLMCGCMMHAKCVHMAPGPGNLCACPVNPASLMPIVWCGAVQVYNSVKTLCENPECPGIVPGNKVFVKLCDVHRNHVWCESCFKIGHQDARPSAQHDTCHHDLFIEVAGVGAGVHNPGGQASHANAAAVQAFVQYLAQAAMAGAGNNNG